MAPSVSVEGLSKRYRLGQGARADYETLRDRIAGVFDSQRKRDEKSELWALRDVNLAIEQGEALGVIGHNGAGKSTLLKILSRITEPTEGRAVLHGRVASLLEVGTGFHPELTGRENIFLNGALLGMSRAETRANFDAIVAFADVERFLDTLWIEQGVSRNTQAAYRSDLALFARALANGIFHRLWGSFRTM